MTLVLGALWLFIRVGSPVYRIERDNVIALLELVIAGEATENDWQVFVSVPVRHNKELTDIQKRCVELAKIEYIGGPGNKLFSARGISELEKLLAEIKQMSGSL
jgi:hypothetical protein